MMELSQRPLAGADRRCRLFVILDDFYAPSYLRQLGLRPQSEYLADDIALAIYDSADQQRNSLMPSRPRYR